MKNKTRGKKAGIAAVTVLSLAGSGGLGQGTNVSQENLDRGAIEMEGRYFCNTKALNPDERAKHAQLTKKLMAKRREVVETRNGYEFQFAPQEVSIEEVTQWVVAESKCCPFFDFHIDLEKQGRLVCLRLSGGANIKAFIRSEFGFE